jgi:mRNA interferase MazF
MGKPRLTRGDVIKAVLPGEYGKPRPCLVVQSDRLAKLDSVILCPLTSDLETDGPTRFAVAAGGESGLMLDSLVMVDKVTAVSRSRCRDHIGRLDAAMMEQIDARLALVIGLMG